MIVDKIERSACYNGLVPEFKEAMEFALSLADKPVGRYEYDGLPAGTVFAMVQEGDTMPYEDGKVEAHRKYMDVQIMLDGGETVYYTDIKGLTEAVPYKEDADIIFYEKAGQPARIEKGMFYLVLPHDGHMPCRELDGPGTYRKVVLKIKVDENL